MDEQGFRTLLAEKPYDRELLLVYADWLEEQGRDDDALAARLQTIVKGRVVILTRDKARDAAGYDARAAREWFANHPGLRIVLIGYRTVSELGLQMMPVAKPGNRRGHVPAADDPTSPLLYHRKSHGYSGMQAAYVRVPF
jgi:uncharacterized protein (TIGR02996 family)